MSDLAERTDRHALVPSHPDGSAGLGAELEELTAALQQLLFPPRAPRIEGLSLAWCYRPASRLQVGGDFLDLFPLGGSSWGLAIGDVCGKGPAAATVAAAARHALRAAAIDRRQPSEVLGVLNDALLLDWDDDTPRFCTAAYGRLRPFRDGYQMSVACAGHPQPLVLESTGRVLDVGISGTVLGVVPEAEFHDHRVYLRPGDTVLLFTDGLTEAGDPAAGLLDRSGVRSIVAGTAGAEPQQVVAALHASAEEQGVVRDDLAIVAIRVDGRD